MVWSRSAKSSSDASLVTATCPASFVKNGIKQPEECKCSLRSSEVHVNAFPHDSGHILEESMDCKTCRRNYPSRRYLSKDGVCAECGGTVDASQDIHGHGSRQSKQSTNSENVKTYPLTYGVFSAIEGTVAYLIAVFVMKWLDSPLPPIGSWQFLVFLATWPFLGFMIRPGLHRVPIVGEAFLVIAPQNNADVHPVVVGAIGLVLIAALLGYSACSG